MNKKIHGNIKIATFYQLKNRIHSFMDSVCVV